MDKNQSKIILMNYRVSRPFQKYNQLISMMTSCWLVITAYPHCQSHALIHHEYGGERQLTFLSFLKPKTKSLHWCFWYGVWPVFFSGKVKWHRISLHSWTIGTMDNMPDYGSEDFRFDSWLVRLLAVVHYMAESIGHLYRTATNPCCFKSLSFSGKAFH